MADTATLEEVKKQVHDLTELVKKQKDEYAGAAETLLKQVLANHPGYTPPSKVEVPLTDAEKRFEDIFQKMPKDLHEECDNILFLSKMLKKEPQQLKSWNPFKSKMGDFKKALDTAETGGGADWIPTDFSSQLYELVRLSGQVQSLFPQINMPSNPYKLPIQIGRLMSFKGAEQTADTSQTPVTSGHTANITGNVTLTAVNHNTMVPTSKNLEEDSIIPILPFLRAEIVTALAEGRETCILNGDTTASHEDSDVTDAGDRRKMWKGLRRLAHDTAGYAVDLSEFTMSTLLDLIGTMGKFGVRPAESPIITGVKGYLKLMKFVQVQTLDKYGPGAVVLNGELANLLGRPVIVSEFVREDLNAGGVYASGATSTVVYVANRRGFVMGIRRDATVQLLTELFALYGQDVLMVWERVVFSPTYPQASNATSVLGQNI
jgi:HK97 family phage major capsid protein